MLHYGLIFIDATMNPNKLRGRQFHSTFQFIDDFCTLNDGGEFSKAFLEIYQAELELKVEHNGSHVTFYRTRKIHL